MNRINRNYAFAFFKDFSFFSAVLVPFFTQWGGISLFQVQLLQSWFSLWVFILEVPTGAVADKIGRKHSIALGSLIVALAVLIYGSWPSFGIFLLAEFLFAIGYAFTSGADQALLYDTLKEEGKQSESKKILGKAESWHLLGILSAAALGSLLASRFGLNAPMLASAIPFFIAALIGWSIVEPKIHTGQPAAPKYLAIVKAGLKTLKTNRDLLILTIDSLLVASAAYFVIWFYQPLLTQNGIPIVYFGFIHAALLGIEVLISANFPFVEKIIGSGKKYLTSSAVLTSLAFIAAAIYPSLLSIGLLIILAGGLGLTRLTYATNMANHYIQSRERATVLSSMSMLRRFSLIILNPLIGYAASRSLGLALFITGLLPLLTLLLPRKTKKFNDLNY